MRRKQGALIPIEQSILDVANNLHQQGIDEFYGLQIIKDLKNHREVHPSTSLGTLYRALRRLEKLGYLVSHWEESPLVESGRPRRRYYRLRNKQKESQM